MPRVGFPGGPRLEWYDRNPQKQSMGYFTRSVAPHAATTRDSYTVPSGKKAWISYVYSELMRASAATTLGIAYLALYSTPASYCLTSHRNNTVGFREWSHAGSGALLDAGEALILESGDGSTAGTVDYYCTVVITEFDA